MRTQDQQQLTARRHQEFLQQQDDAAHARSQAVGGARHMDRSVLKRLMQRFNKLSIYEKTFYMSCAMVLASVTAYGIYELTLLLMASSQQSQAIDISVERQAPAVNPSSLSPVFSDVPRKATKKKKKLSKVPYCSHKEVVAGNKVPGGHYRLFSVKDEQQSHRVILASNTPFTSVDDMVKIHNMFAESSNLVLQTMQQLQEFYVTHQLEAAEKKAVKAICRVIAESMVSTTTLQTSCSMSVSYSIWKYLVAHFFKEEKGLPIMVRVEVEGQWKDTDLDMSRTAYHTLKNHETLFIIENSETNRRHVDQFFKTGASTRNLHALLEATDAINCDAWASVAPDFYRNKKEEDINSLIEVLPELINSAVFITPDLFEKYPSLIEIMLKAALAHPALLSHLKQEESPSPHP